jgi:hypothetical protein
VSAANFNAAIAWIALNDDEGAGNPKSPLVTEALVADLFGTTTPHVCICVQRFRWYTAHGKKPPRMKALPWRFKSTGC